MIIIFLIYFKEPINVYYETFRFILKDCINIEPNRLPPIILLQGIYDIHSEIKKDKHFILRQIMGT